MDQLSIYANVESAVAKPGEVNNSDCIYQNEEAWEANKTGPAHSDAGDKERGEKSSCKAAAVSLALLCLLLLGGLTTALVLLYTSDHSPWKIEEVKLQTSYNNLTKERDQLQTSYNNLTKERDQLQTSYYNLTKERDQLQTSYNNLAKERDQLQTSYNNLAKERDQLQTSYNDLNKERDLQMKLLEKAFFPKWVKFGSSYYYVSTEVKTWEQSRQECQRKGADLVIINSREEQQFVIKFNKRVWIGLTDHEQESVWKWVDGTTLTTSFWNDRQPDNNGGEGKSENCVELFVFYSDPLSKWNDLNCLESNYWVCEMSH